MRRRARRPQPQTVPAQEASPFRLTYATMFDPPRELHTQFDAALAEVRANLGVEHAMLIGGEEVRAGEQFESRSPIDTDLELGRFQQGGPEHVEAAVHAARTAFADWSRTPWLRRVELVERAAALVEASVFHLAAAVSLEVGKNRMEALGDVQETVDLMRWYCNEMRANGGYVRELARDPLAGYVSRNWSVLKPFGVWAVIAPFNFPFALAGGPSAAALIAGNCVVYKAASATPWCGWLLAQCMREAGLAPGVFNFLTGSGARVGEPLVRHASIGGITFTGSYEAGMRIVRANAEFAYPRPCITEMGGKNAAIVSRDADLERAALGIVRSAFGLQGQKCSACSRVLAEAPVLEELGSRIAEKARALRIGDPTLAENWLGPVIDRSAYERYREASAELARAGRILTGARTLAEGERARGYFCEPTVAELALTHRFWTQELFLPIVTLAPVASVDEAIDIANATQYGLTAGFFGPRDQAQRFFERIEAGVTYCNRPQGATTGSWPGHQPFGGWKGSGSTGKGAGSCYYLPQYMREQSQTIVE